MDNIIYIKKVDDYNEIFKKKHRRMPMILKKLAFLYKNIFNIITKKKLEDSNIWILPIQEKYSDNKMNSLLKKFAKNFGNIFVISNDLRNNHLYKLMHLYDIDYLRGERLKTFLSIKILEYINNIQNNELENIEVTVLVNDVSELNAYIIEKISKLVKSIKVVSPNIYKFKNLEEKLYNEYGIAIQFSNSYRKSLAKSKYIINLDFSQIDLNEYEIFNKAIIINCLEDNIKIKSKLFNGIVINSCNIKFKKEIRDKFKKIDIYHKYNSLLLYESTINQEKSFNKIWERLEEDKVIISNLIGNNGVINKKEFKNINKKLDK